MDIHRTLGPIATIVSFLSVLPAAAPASPSAVAAAVTPLVRVSITLKYRHAAELQALIRAQGDESSPLFRHFVQPSAFERYFAPAQFDYERVQRSLARAGYSVVKTFANRLLVDALAPPSVAAHIPADVADAVSAVSIGRALPPGSGQARQAYAGLRKSESGSSSSVPFFGPDGGYGPLVFTEAYALATLEGFTGTGRTAGYVMNEDFRDSDVASYLSYFNVTRTGPATVRVLIDGSQPGQFGLTSTMDAETLVSLAPGAGLYLYLVSSSTDTGQLLDAFNQAVVDDQVDSLDTSVGFCEFGYPQFATQTATVEQQAVAEGITFYAPTGDLGAFAYGCSNQISVDAPSILPESIGVGGTMLHVNPSTGRETSERGWRDLYGASGGGVSVVYPLPSYQSNTKHVIRTGRNEPDIAFDASPATGESAYYRGAFAGPVGGTALSAAIFGAVATETAQAEGSRLGFFNPGLYLAWQRCGYGNGDCFRDIVKGSNYLYRAGRGYDQVTGIGAIQGVPLAATLRFGG